MRLLDELVVDAEQDPETVGVVLTGSRSVGIEDERSDVDLAWVLVAGVSRPRRRERVLDIAYHDVAGWRELCATRSWWTSGLAYARVLLDKTGQVEDALRLARSVPQESPHWHYGSYLNSFIRSTRAWERDDELGARLHACESLAWLAKLLFALEGRVAPYHDRLFVHLDERWLPAFRNVAATAGIEAQRSLEERVEALMRERGSTEHDEWGDQLRQAKGR